MLTVKLKLIIQMILWMNETPSSYEHNFENDSNICEQINDNCTVDASDQ